jgi:hypothetical protein
LVLFIYFIEKKDIRGMSAIWTASNTAGIRNNREVKSHTPDHSFFIPFFNALKMQVFIYFKVQ